MRAAFPRSRVPWRRGTGPVSIHRRVVRRDHQAGQRLRAGRQLRRRADGGASPGRPRRTWGSRPRPSRDRVAAAGRRPCPAAGDRRHVHTMSVAAAIRAVALHRGAGTGPGRVGGAGRGGQAGRLGGLHPKQPGGRAAGPPGTRRRRPGTGPPATPDRPRDPQRGHRSRLPPGPAEGAAGAVPDPPLTGGYPVVAVVADDEIDRAAQLRPGQRVRFDLGD